MAIDKKELTNALDLVKPGLATKEVIEQSNCFLFNDDRVGSYNDEISVSFPLNIGISNCAVQSKELLDLLGKIEDEKIKLKDREDQLLIIGKKFRSGITMVKELTIPTDFMSIDAKFKPLPKDFCIGLKVCLFSTAPKGIFDNIHVNGEIMESCDNYRSTRYTMRKKIKDELLIPSAAARHLKNSEVSSYAKIDGWIHFKNKDGLVFSTRTTEDKFVDLSVFMEVEGEKITLPKELSTALNRSEVFSEDGSGHMLISVSIKGTKALIKSRNDAGWFKEKVKIKGKAEQDYAFQINPKMLKEILGITSKAILSETNMLFHAKGFDHSVILYVEEEEDE